MGTRRAAAQHAQEHHAWPPRWLRWLPPALVVLTVVLDVLLPPHYTFGSLIAASVVLAALVYPVPAVALTGLVGIGALLALHALDGVVEMRLVGILLTLVVVTAVSAVLAAVRERARWRLSRVEAVAEAVQLALLRPLPARLGPLRLAGFYRAADDEALIGGDLYSVRPTPFGVRVVVGDVKGKGVGATGTVATVTAAFRESAMVQPRLDEVAERIETALDLDRADARAGEPGVGAGPSDPGAEVDRPETEEVFVTAVLLEFEDDGSAVRVLDRGHPPLLRLGPGGASELDAEYGVPLGFGELAGREPRTERFELAPGELLVAYSDGVTEARDAAGEFYPLAERLTERYGTGSRYVPPDPADVVTFLQADVASWAAGLADDMVVVVLRPEAGAVAGAGTGAGAAAGPGAAVGPGAGPGAAAPP